ncbi:mannitol dehydrogenase family protein [Sphingomonas rubra]|uniref:mannitol dehydrogenase family protein n=1 Tax=Sphingomonas rubra TaxID=634430 RepID=UPI003CCB9DA1
MVLSNDTLARLPAAIPAPRDRGGVGVGIVHFGPGAFHRAHQAAYVDALLDRDPRWGIAAVSMRSRGTVDALAQQDGLYTLAIRDAAPSFRVIGAHRRFLGPSDAAETRALLADPAVGLVTTTVTEKGYCLAADGTLDLAHPDIVHDLAGPAVPASVVGWIVAGLAARRAAGTAPFVILPCDNLASNGAKIRAALIAFARATDRGLADWIERQVDVRSTMVDSITPAGDEALAHDVAAALGGLADDAAVQREAFTQWVIEDNGRPLGPDLASVGATLTPDVAGYERAKLRILNGAHSTLAYAGLLRGHAGVAEAMRDEALAGFVDAMIRRDIVPALPPVPGLDLDAYRAAVLDRFCNPGIVHRLEQIAQDGSQKLPYRLGDTLAANRAAGRMPGHVVAALGCWVAFLMTRAAAGTAIVDPAASRLAEVARGADPAAVVRTLADEAIGFLPGLAADPAAVEAIGTAAARAAAGQWNALLASDCS